MQALWESEEGIQARVWPRRCHPRPTGGGKHSAAGRAELLGPSSHQQISTPGIVTRPLHVPWVPLSFLPVHTFGVPVSLVGPQLCSPCPGASPSLQHKSCSRVFPQHSRQVCNSCTAAWDFCDIFCKQTPWELPASESPQDSDREVLLSPHPMLVSPVAQSFAKAIGSVVCLGVAEHIQKHHKHRHFQAALRYQEENKVSKQLHWTPNYIKGNPPSSFSRKVRFSLVAGSGCFCLKGRGSRLKLPRGSSIRTIIKNE